MAKEDLYIGSAPAAEDCAQLGKDGYHAQARRECRALIEQLRRMFGPEPTGCGLYIKSNPHDFGDYLSVNCSWNEGDQVGADYAFRCEAELPEEWDAEAKADLQASNPKPAAAADLQRSPKFSLGQVVATPGALEALVASGDKPEIFLARHVCGDWGDLCAEDKALNDTAILAGSRIFSAYQLRDGTKLWIITEHDRSVTTLLLPSEY